MAGRIGSESVVRLRAVGPAPRHGERAGEVETTIAGCAVIPRTSSEDTDLGDTVIVGLTLVCPPKTDLVATDRVRHRGHLYEVDGSPGRYVTRRGREKAVVAALRRVTG